MPTASHAKTAPPAGEVLVARQPVLDAEMNLLGFELLVDGAAVVADALSEVGLEKLTGGHAAWLPLGRELLLDIGPVPVRSERVVLRVHAGEGDEDALLDAVRQLADRGACIALDRMTYRPALGPLLDLAWGVKIDLAAHAADAVRAQVGALAGRDLVLIATSVDTNEDLAMCRALGFHAFQGAFLAEPAIVPAAPSRRGASTRSARSPTSRRASSSRTSSARSCATSASATSSCATPTRRCSRARSGSARCARRSRCSTPGRSAGGRPRL